MLWIARRCVKIGIGLSVKDSKNFSAIEIENNIKIIIENNSFKEKCKYWKLKCRKSGGLEKSTEIIKNILDEINIEKIDI